MEFFRQEYPSPGDLLDPRIEPLSPALQADGENLIMRTGLFLSGHQKKTCKEDRICRSGGRRGVLRHGFQKTGAVRVFPSSTLFLCPDLDSETLKAAKVWNLAEVLAGEQQQSQAAKSQQKEQMVLLEKKSATYSQVCQGSGVASLLFYPDPRGPLREARDFFFWSCRVAYGSSSTSHRTRAPCSGSTES